MKPVVACKEDIMHNGEWLAWSVLKMVEGPPNIIFWDITACLWIHLSAQAFTICCFVGTVATTHIRIKKQVFNDSNT